MSSVTDEAWHLRDRIEVLEAKRAAWQAKIDAAVDGGDCDDPALQSALAAVALCDDWLAKKRRELANVRGEMQAAAAMEVADREKRDAHRLCECAQPRPQPWGRCRRCGRRISPARELVGY